MSGELILRQTSLSANIIAFCRFLRQQGFTIGPLEEADALLALESLAPFNQPANMQLCLKAALARTRAQQLIFDELYTQYWRELEKAVNSKRKKGDAEASKQKKPSNKLLSIKNWLQGQAPTEEVIETATYSQYQSLAQKDFSTFADDQLWEIIQLIQRIARTLALRKSRRKKSSHQPVQLDLRRTLRNNMRRGGEIFDLAYFNQQRHKQQIVLLCDVSKSMDLYSRFLIQFIYAFQNAYRRIETFVFSTELHRVSKQLKEQEFGIALQNLSANVPGWSGGTRIGSSLQHFCSDYAGKILDKRTIVIIMSDGWDTGEPSLVSESMQQIQRKTAKVIWLNPLAGKPDYEPATRGMQAAMPYIDVFASAHNVESLRQLSRHLG